MKHLTTILIVLTHLSWSSAQSVNSKLKDVSLPTPAAAEFGKYVDMPVSYETGIPNISIPVYELASGKLRHNVSLSYHSGGIPVVLPGPRTGLGWTLNAGGIISRTQRGLYDDQPDIGYAIKGSYLTATDPNELNNASIGALDTEPDVFSYNFAGYTGKFVFDGKGSM